MTNLFYDIYLPNISASMIMALSFICIVLPYTYKIKKTIKSNSLHYMPNISGNIWNPILTFLAINIFIYNLFVLRFFYKKNTGNLIIKHICLIAICWSFLYTIFGVIMMADYIERAYNVWDFKVIMSLLFAVSFIKFTLEYIQEPGYLGYVLYLYTLVCIVLLVLMSLMVKKFKYYISK